MKDIDLLNNNVLDIEALSFYNEFQLATDLLISWKGKAEAAQSQNTLKELKACADALARIGIYVSQMQTRQREYDIQISKWRMAKLKADETARNAIQELEDYKIEL